MILDCGEGSWGQLVRLLGRTAASRVAAHLTAVYVSHHHADHHIGLISLLQARAAALTEAGAKVGVVTHVSRLSQALVQYMKSYNARQPVSYSFSAYIFIYAP